MLTKIFVGIDWGSETHTVCALDRAGQRLWMGEVRHRGEDILSFADEMLALAKGDPRAVVVAIETTHGAIIEALLDRGIEVYSINPKQLDRFRDRYSVAGAKDDPLDAFVLADTLRTDRALYRQVELGGTDLVTLRELSRCYDTLADQAQSLGCQVQELLRRYHVALLELGDWHQHAWLWDLFELAPTPEKARMVSRDQVEALTRNKRIRKSKVDQVLAAFSGAPLPVAPGVAEATSERLTYLLPLLRTIHQQRKACFKRISILMRSPATTTGVSEKVHRDATLLLSLPGMAERIGAAMLTEASTALRNRDYQALRRMCGTAPVSKRTGGKSKKGRLNSPQVSMRRACNLRLRNAAYLWGMGALRTLPRCRSHYAQLRSKGHTHARSIRGVVDRLLKLLIAMLVADRPFDPQKWALPTPSPA
jgi:transposase